MHPCIFLFATLIPLQSLPSSHSLLSACVQPVGGISIRGNGGRREVGIFFLNPFCFDPETVAGAPGTAAPGRQPLTMAPGLMGVRQHSFLPICWVQREGRGGSFGCFTQSYTVKVLIAQSCLTLATLWIVASRILCPWNFPGKNTGVSCLSLLQGIFPTQGLNPGLLHYGRFFTNGAIGNAQPYIFSLSHICSCHLAHTSLRSTFLKVSSFELSGSKLCFLLYPWLRKNLKEVWCEQNIWNFTL